MLLRMWRRRNSYTLLVGMLNGAVTMENNSMVVPQKVNIELPYDPVIPFLGTYTKELKAEY